MNKIRIMGTGSSGNCYSLETNKERILLDVGFMGNRIVEFLNYDTSNVVGALVTHEHKDHSKGVKTLTEKYGIDVYATDGTLEKVGVHNHRTHTITKNKKIKLGGFTVLPFDVEHDAKDPVGFMINHKDIGNVLYITDTYYVKYTFKNVQHILIECNYMKEIIDEKLEDKMFLRNRIVGSHFELQNVIEFLKVCDLSDIKTITLIHLSDSNSDGERFKKEIEKAIGYPVEIAEKGKEIYL